MKPLTDEQFNKAIRRLVTSHYGPRCEAYCNDCVLCRAWKACDVLTGDKPDWPVDGIDEVTPKKNRGTR